MDNECKLNIQNCFGQQECTLEYESLFNKCELVDNDDINDPSCVKEQYKQISIKENKELLDCLDQYCDILQEQDIPEDLTKYYKENYQNSTSKQQQSNSQQQKHPNEVFSEKLYCLYMSLIKTCKQYSDNCVDEECLSELSKIKECIEQQKDCDLQQVINDLNNQRTKEVSQCIVNECKFITQPKQEL